MRNVRQQLKAERVQEPEALLAPQASPPGTALKAERVQLLLQGMPGWSLLPGARAIGRVREFASPAHAEAFAGYVAKLTLAERLPVTLNLTPSQVIVTVHGRIESNCTGALSEDAFALARAIG